MGLTLGAILGLGTEQAVRDWAGDTGAVVGSVVCGAVAAVVRGWAV